MKKLLVYIPLILLTACGGNDKPEVQETPETEEQIEIPVQETPKDKPVMEEEEDSHEAPENDAAEDKVMDAVWELPEVQKLDKEIRKRTKNKFGVKTYIASGPSDDQEYYSVAVAEDNGAQLVNQYFIYVYPDMSLRYYDIVEDRVLTIEEWRKSMKRK